MAWGGSTWERIKVLTSSEPHITFQNWGSELDGAGIVTGNSATDKISYDINSWQVILDRLYKLNNTIKFRPRIGINILDTSLQYSSAGQNVKEKQLAPLPFLGFHSELKFNNYEKICFTLLGKYYSFF